jgi:glycosyltransferase involved in cell wall biosynthesis
LSLFHIDAGREWRGGQRQALFLVRYLHQKGFPLVFVVQPESPLHEKASEAGLPVLPIKMRSELDPIAMIRLAVAMKRRKCRLVHFHDAHGLGVGSTSASLAGVPLRVISRRVDFPLPQNILSRRKYRKDVDVIIAISEGVKEVLVKGGIAPANIEVIPSGIDFSPFREVTSRDFLRREFSFASDDYLVGIVAHLEDHKGHKYLIKAAELLKAQAPNIRIVVVGEGSLKFELTKQVRELHVEDLVFFLGFRDDVPRILASLDLFVLSSHLEGLGSSIMDAMASRLPVVATRTGGIPEVVVDGETGLLVPPRDPAALAEGILRLYRDRELAKKLGQRGYEVVCEKFSAEAMAERVIALYQKIAAPKGIDLLV